jgi:hypothetical protein
VLALIATPACNELNPLFDQASDAGGSGGGSTGGATGSTTDGGSTSVDDSATSGGASGGATTGTSSTTASAGTTPGATTTGATNGTTTGNGAGSVDYSALLAECVGDDGLDPDACEDYAGEGVPGHMAIDLVSDDDELLVAYLAFPVDAALQGKTVTAVTLRLETTDLTWSESDATGEIWAVEPFTLSDLFSLQPAKTGATALAPDQGPAGLSQPVSWSLPVDSVSPDSTIYLGLFPVSTNGVYYWNLDGTAPPVLVVDYQ